MSDTAARQRLIDYERDPEIRQMEQEEPPRWRTDLTYYKISPLLTEEKYRELHNCYLQPHHGPKEIQPNTVYFDAAQKQIKFLLLKNALIQSYSRALSVLENADWQNCDRAANGQKHGKKITIGWLPQIPGRAKGSGHYGVRTAQTIYQPNLLHGLRAMLTEMDAILHEMLPPYYQKAMDAAFAAVQRDGQEDDLSKVPQLPEELRGSMPDPLSVVRNIDPWNFLYTLAGTVFSTLELNRNILFKAHEDKGNVQGALICITALGRDFVGGRLVFPRYGYSAELRPTDLLICDNNHELHGNLGPLVGERFSVVAYFHKSLIDYAHRNGHWRTNIAPK